MKISKPISIIFLLGILTGYFFIIGAYPIGLLCVPVCLVFFRFSKEKLSAHINLFAFIATVCGLAVYHNSFLNNYRKLIIWFFAILILNILGKTAKKKFPVFMQITSLVFWGLAVCAFLLLSTVHTETNISLAKTLKMLSLFFCGSLGLPPAPLFIPTVSMFRESVCDNCMILMVSALPAIIINMFKECRKEYIDFKFSAYYILSLIFGILFACIVLSSVRLGEWGETIYQLSIIIPSIILYGINIRNTAKTFRHLKKNKTP